MTYDAVNNMIWMASTDWMDQFYNPGHQASHHTLKKLGLDPLHITLPIKGKFNYDFRKTIQKHFSPSSDMLMIFKYPQNYQSILCFWHLAFLGTIA